MTQHYIPAPYCGFSEMRRLAYEHLFPAPKDDLELLHLCDVAIGEGEADIKTSKDLHPGHFDSAPSIHGHHITPPPSIVQRSVSANRLLQRGTLRANWGRNTLNAIALHSFDAPKLLLPKVTVSFALLVGPDSPDIAVGFLLDRVYQYMTVVRDHLYKGRLTAHYKSRDGILPIGDRNVWLDDSIAAKALGTGQLSHSPQKFRTSLGALEMIFDSNELSEHFPPYNDPDADNGAAVNNLPGDSEPQQTKGGRRNKLSPAIEALRRLHPNGRPDISNELLRRKVEDEIGITVGTSTMTKAISKAWAN